MIDSVLPSLILTAAVGAGLVGGLFFAFSTFIMKAFDRLPPTQAIAAMQAINVAVINPIFFVAFFGTGLVALALAVLAIAGSAGAKAPLILIGAAAYLLGSIGVTAAFNVPLNNRLAAVGMESGESSEDWPRYRGPWTAWNHVRTVASLGAAAAFAAAMGA